MLGIILAILGFFLLVTIGWFWGGYNTFVRGCQNIKTILANLKAEYQRRADLFYNLAESVKANAKFEKSTLVEIIAMRSGNFGNSTKESLSKMKKLDGLFNKLMLVVENYPKLTSTENFTNLMNEVRITEDRVNIARTEYNDTVRDYNLSVVSFPSNILANMFRFKEEIYFESEAGTEKSPKLDLKI